MSLNTNEHDWAHLGMIDIITHDYTRLSIYAYKITIDCLCIISLISEIDAGLSHIINIGANDTILRVSDNDK